MRCFQDGQRVGGDLSPGGWTRSFLNDTLIAASLRETGATLITRNVRDFARIGAVESFAFEAPWPEVERQE